MPAYSSVPVTYEKLMPNVYNVHHISYVCTEHRLVSEGLPENSVANLHGITVVRVRLKPDNASLQIVRIRCTKLCPNRQEMS